MVGVANLAKRSWDPRVNERNKFNLVMISEKRVDYLVPDCCLNRSRVWYIICGCSHPGESSSLAEQVDRPTEHDGVEWPPVSANFGTGLVTDRWRCSISSSATISFSFSGAVCAAVGASDIRNGIDCDRCQSFVSSSGPRMPLPPWIKEPNPWIFAFTENAAMFKYYCPCSTRSGTCFYDSD